MTADQSNPTCRELRADRLRKMLIWMSVPIVLGGLLAGVMLTCTHCEKIASFTNEGEAAESSGGDIHRNRDT